MCMSVSFISLNHSDILCTILISLHTFEHRPNRPNQTFPAFSQNRQIKPILHNRLRPCRQLCFVFPKISTFSSFVLYGHCNAEVLSAMGELNACILAHPDDHRGRSRCTDTLFEKKKKASQEKTWMKLYRNVPVCVKERANTWFDFHIFYFIHNVHPSGPCCGLQGQRDLDELNKIPWLCHCVHTSRARDVFSTVSLNERASFTETANKNAPESKVSLLPAMLGFQKILQQSKFSEGILGLQLVCYSVVDDW